MLTGRDVAADFGSALLAAAMLELQAKTQVRVLSLFISGYRPLFFARIPYIHKPVLANARCISLSAISYCSSALI